MAADTLYCDHCGNIIKHTGLQVRNFFAISRLAYDIDSANAGESAQVCVDCVGDLEKKKGSLLR